MRLCGLTKKNKKRNQFYKVFTKKQNRIQAKEFALVPFSRRVVFVPHCMRNTSVCAALEKDGYYVCAECNGCKINDISMLMKELTYQALYVLKGGRKIESIIKSQSPKAVVGVACFLEGYQAFKILEYEKISVQFIPLTKDGCVATDIDLAEVKKVLKQCSV
jgi:hypothetical protein